ncbi:ABC transporter substrate-binding protein [Oricola sp.]|uniref:ABC transporter substrate-binding protein n=1 Tax=Oricola sp. TaxID=1979950 RepID=UPI00320BE0BD|nr:extracellular solute-binding protein [Oricola sp.]
MHKTKITRRAAFIAGAGIAGMMMIGNAMAQSDADALGGPEAAASLDALYQQAISNGENKVVVYGGLAKAYKGVFDAFQARYPEIEVQTQIVFGAALFARIGQEFTSDQHVADIVHVGATAMVPLLNADQIEPYAPEIAKVDPYWVGPDNAFVFSSLNVSGYFYNTDLVSDADRPTSWGELVGPDWTGKVGISDPTNPGGTAELFTTLMYGGVMTDDYLGKLKANDTKIDADWAPLVQTVLTGQRAVGVGPVYGMVNTAIQKGAPLKYNFPLDDANVLLPIGFAIIKNAPDMAAAKLLASWVFTPEAQALIGAAGFYGTQEGDLGTPEGLPPLSKVPNIVELPVLTERAGMQNAAREELTRLLK